ncbi:MAG TPA: hypothetical protein VE172_25175 [Stackebrandtia sp.]|jgi:4-amino-4-deoxy-L-arabinose transferase-like glycosyltransferase|uniref:hypothetical protein n=1 Tax=Stackebrandtia sp. TaxID=2023065 RepID=UPI002D2D27C6|nr:hypothetical protein [Stackebrandtia sp.]HZE42102.1 hypothetical protein [Stackebrandtia sp.]
MLVIGCATLTVALLTVALRPRLGRARWRLAVARAAVVTGAAATVAVEALSYLGWFDAAGVGGFWAVMVVAAAALCLRRARFDHLRASTVFKGGWTRCRELWRGLGRWQRVGAVAVAAIVGLELLLAAWSAPNNFDSQTYHLPKIEHWVQQGSVGFFATNIHRQVTLAPGAEYLLAHLRLASGTDAYYNLLQWAAGLGCVLVATRICAQLGGGRRAQLLTALLLATTPMLVLQASSTQVDLVAAAWTGCVATVALDGLRRRADVAAVLVLGAGTGLVAITKTTGLLGVGPILVLWGLAQLRLALRRHDKRLRRVLTLAVSTLAILALAAVVVAPYLMRMQSQFGNPLGPPRLRASIPMQTHDPASVLVNTLRIGQTAFDTPIPGLTHASAWAIDQIAATLGVDPQDPAITFGHSTFPDRAWPPNEDKVSFPIAGVLALLAVALALARPGSVTSIGSRGLRAYAAAVTLSVLLFTATVKWQPWVNRLVLYALVLAIPIAGLWLDSLLRKGSREASTLRRLGAAVVAAALALSVCAGLLSVAAGLPRRVVGPHSTLTSSRMENRFAWRPPWRSDYEWAARAVTEADAHAVGLLQTNDSWEYPWWVLLRGHRIEALQSVIPGRPAADAADMDAIVCTMPRRQCARHIPPGWTFHYRHYAGYALPPGE